MNPYRKLLLWDIDGTLLNVHGASREAFANAMKALHDRETEWGKVHFGGTTDLEVVEQLFALNGVTSTDKTRVAFLQEFARHYANEAHSPLAEKVLHPGAREALEACARHEDWLQGLLTGNARETAHIKLGLFDLNDFFHFGAYGDERQDRCDLARLAVERAIHATGQVFDPTEIYVIGDTGNDVRCAHAIGARVIAVETGRYSHDSLEGTRPDARIKDLSDTKTFVRLLEEL